MSNKPIFVVGTVFVAGLLCQNGCKASEQPSAQSPPIKTVCLSCKSLGNLTIDKPVREEPWPKPCPSCKKVAVYAYRKLCGNCSEPVPLKDPATGGFGYPTRCPSCKKKWES